MFNKIKRMSANFIDLFKYPRIRLQLSKKRDLYFFFPSWSFGGAERVHIDILNIFKDQDPLCFITERSISDGFRKEFEAAADVIDLGRWSEKKTYKLHLHRKIAKTINAQKHPVVSGWGSRFMYELIPFLDAHVKIIDIIHNFTDDGDGIEWYSIPYISRLDKRIIVGKGIIDQFKELYKFNQVPAHYLNRLTVIQNKIPFDNDFPEKNYDGVLQVLFVARNSAEKRADIFIKIAQLCHQSNLPVEFKMIGDFSSYQNDLPSNTQIIGVVNNKAVLDSYYKKAHLLLLTSYRESWGLVIFEGMNFGVVPISTNVGELSSYISTEKENGILIENLDQKEHLAALFVKEIELFLNNRSRLKKFSKNAFETVKQLAEESDFVNSYKTILLRKQA